MALKKSELYSSIWKSCDELRGGMDASQYKDYVLTLLFVKYVSDKYAGKQDPLIEVPVGGGFKDMIALKGKPNIGEGINIIVSKLAEANDLKGVIDQADFNDTDKLGSGKDMQDKLQQAREKTKESHEKQQQANQSQSQDEKNKQQQEANEKTKAAQNAVQKYQDSAEKNQSQQDMQSAQKARQDLQKA